MKQIECDIIITFLIKELLLALLNITNSLVYRKDITIMMYKVLNTYSIERFEEK